ncbi:LysM peptidoglycan-binding domain-containing protein [Limosilactobacillus panis]|uniref:LysM domain protein n=1 Tax=Limosilactobacillus panis DSM 6035 TaxID=1423782 RepID=A0A0R1XH45_9LACO|nr:LysM peptidoglycan-binding domain-containing protein [Limosilactobacillus panis]KRM29514.1 LysM domain protein [Limosilactobacillus panis DSM 6035]
MNTKKNFVKAFATLGAVALGVTSTAVVANADMVYTVKSGDTLSSISYKFAKDNSLINEIAKDNNLSDVNHLQVGQKLLIKGDGEISTMNTQNTQATQTNNTQQNKDNTTGDNTADKASQSNNLFSADQAAKEWIAQHESGGSYTAQNGRYYGRYQLDLAYLGGDLSPQHQEEVAQQYMQNRYGSWQAAQAHWEANGWW